MGDFASRRSTHDSDAPFGKITGETGKVVRNGAEDEGQGGIEPASAFLINRSNDSRQIRPTANTGFHWQPALQSIRKKVVFILSVV